MKEFLLKTLLVAIVPFSALILVDLWLRNQDSLYESKYQSAIIQKDSIEVLILGNSHACYGVDPKSFSRYAFNLANVGQSLYFDKRITLSLADRLPNLKQVLISIDYHSLYFSSQGTRDAWSYYGNGIKYKDKSYALYDLSPFLFGYTPKVSASLAIKKFKNYLRFGQVSLPFDLEDGINLQDTLVKGFVSFAEVNHQMFNSTQYLKRVNEFNSSMQMAERDSVLADLDGFIQELITLNIEPVLITTPTYSDYNQYLDSAIINQNTIAIDELCRKHNIKHLDFMNDSSFMKLEYFHNCDHLNKVGAAVFSKTLDSQLN